MMTLITGVFFIISLLQLIHPAKATAQSTLPLVYLFDVPGTLAQTTYASQSSSPYFWLRSGGILSISGGRAYSNQGKLAATNYWRTKYDAMNPTATDNGYRPQNVFTMFSRASLTNVSVQIYVDRVRDNLSNNANRHPYNGEMLYARYVDDNNYYLAGLHADGTVLIQKKVDGVYTTLASKQFFAGSYGANGDYDLIPGGKWLGIKFLVANNVNGTPVLSVYTDIGWSGSWKLALTAKDSGSTITGAGLAGITSNFADIELDNFVLSDPGGASTPTLSAQQTAPTSSYDSVVLAGAPMMYLTMSSPAAAGENDKSGHGLSGTYVGGSPSAAKMPNGDTAADFNGSGQYLTVPSNAAFSIPTKGQLTWEGWIRPDTFDFPNENDEGFVDWMGKCQNYSPNCEWEARLYGASTLENRPERLSAYVFNPSASLGSGSDWQPAPGVVAAGHWLYVVAEYDLTSTPSPCDPSYPGTINIWVNGVKQSFIDHAPTGCMSQFKVKPVAGNSSLDIGTMGLDTFFKGAVGKVAIYDRLLSPTEISAHFEAMTGSLPSGSCGVTCTLP